MSYVIFRRKPSCEDCGMSKQLFSIGDRVRVTRSGHVQDQQIGIIQSVEPAGASWLVQVYVRVLPFEYRRAWHSLSFLSAVKNE